MIRGLELFKTLEKEGWIYKDYGYTKLVRGVLWFVRISKNNEFKELTMNEDEVHKILRYLGKE